MGLSFGPCTPLEPGFPGFVKLDSSNRMNQARNKNATVVAVDSPDGNLSSRAEPRTYWGAVKTRVTERTSGCNPP